jgi:hypothetical protein
MIGGGAQMRLFEYFAKFEESMSIVGDLCAQGFTIIVEPHLLDEPKAQSFDHVTPELTAILERAPSFYLSGTFTVFPVQFERLKEGAAAGKYTIDQLTLGPIMQGMVSRINVVNGARRLLPGDISYQDRYRHPDAGEWVKPSSELKAAFRQAVATIKKRCIRHEYVTGETMFIARDALELLSRGEVELKSPFVGKRSNR